MGLQEGNWKRSIFDRKQVRVIGHLNIGKVVHSAHAQCGALFYLELSASPGNRSGGA